MKSIAEALRNVAKDLCCDEDQVTFRNNYSGRGMYRAQCVGLVGGLREINVVIAEVLKLQRQELSDAVEAVIEDRSNETLEALELAEREMDTAIDMLLDYSMDSMGMKSIVYWPDILPLEDTEEDE